MYTMQLQTNLHPWMYGGTISLMTFLIISFTCLQRHLERTRPNLAQRLLGRLAAGAAAPQRQVSRADLPRAETS